MNLLVQKAHRLEYAHTLSLMIAGSRMRQWQCSGICKGRCGGWCGVVGSGYWARTNE